MIVAIEGALGVSQGALVDIYDLLDAESLPGWMRDWVIEERRSTTLRSFELAVIPGLLQTEEYARAILGNEALPFRRGWNARRFSPVMTPPLCMWSWTRRFWTAASAGPRSCITN